MLSRRSTRKSSTDWWIWTHFLCIPIRFVVSPLELSMHWFLYNHSIWLPIHLTVTVIWLGLQVGFNVYIYLGIYIILNEWFTFYFAADWLRTKGFTTGGPRCAYPSHLQDRPIHALPTHEFRCTGNIIFLSLKIYNNISK